MFPVEGTFNYQVELRSAAHVLTLYEGKVVRLREYFDTAAMVAAFRGV